MTDRLKPQYYLILLLKAVGSLLLSYNSYQIFDTTNVTS
jgi:hypothetical protein